MKAGAASGNEALRREPLPLAYPAVDYDGFPLKSPGRPSRAGRDY